MIVFILGMLSGMVLLVLFAAFESWQANKRDKYLK